MSSKFSEESDQNLRDFAVIQGYLYDYLRQKPHIWREQLGKRPIYTPDWVTSSELFSALNVRATEDDVVALNLMTTKMFLSMYNDIINVELNDGPPLPEETIETITYTDGSPSAYAEAEESPSIMDQNDNSKAWNFPIGMDLETKRLAQEILTKVLRQRKEMADKEEIDFQALAQLDKEDAYWVGRAHQAEINDKDGASIQATDGSSISISATAHEQPKLFRVSCRYGEDFIASVVFIKRVFMDNGFVTIEFIKDGGNIHHTTHLSFEEFSKVTGIKIGGLNDEQ